MFKVFSSIEFQDPATPVFEAFVKDPAVFRVMVPEDLARVHNIGLVANVSRIVISFTSLLIQDIQYICEIICLSTYSKSNIAILPVFAIWFLPLPKII